MELKNDIESAFVRYYTVDYVEVYRHQQPFVTDMVINILYSENIPCYMQEGSIAGILRAAVFPVAAPGIEYIVFVPKKLYEEAKNIIDTLPIDRELLNVKWRRSSDPKRQFRLFVFWFIMLGGWVASILLTLLRNPH